MANMKPSKALYNVVRVQQNAKICNRVSFYLIVFAKILQKDVNKDQKRNKANTVDSITREKIFETTKLIPSPKNTKIYTKMQKNKKINGMCLKQKLENRMS